MIIGIVSVLNSDQTTTEQVKFAQFNEKLEQGQVRNLTIKPERQVYLITGQFTDTEEDNYFQTYVLKSEETVERLFNAQGVNGAALDLDVQPADETSGWVAFFTGIIPFIIIFILFFFLLSQAQAVEAVS